MNHYFLHGIDDYVSPTAAPVEPSEKSQGCCNNATPMSAAYSLKYYPQQERFIGM